EGGTGAKGSAGDRTVTSGNPSADTRNDESGGTRNDGTHPDGKATGSAGSGSGSGTSDPGTGAGGPDGSAGDEGGTSATKTYKGSQGYPIGLPEGWTFQTPGAAGDRFTGPDGQKLLIGWTTTPKDDPVADWTKQ